MKKLLYHIRTIRLIRQKREAAVIKFCLDLNWSVLSMRKTHRAVGHRKPLINKLFLILLGAFLMSLTLDKPFVIYKGDKYYEIDRYYDGGNDTVFYPGGFMIVKTKSIVITYDHFAIYNENKKK